MSVTVPRHLLIYQNVFQALIEAHDDVAAGNFEELPEFVPISSPPPQVYSNGVQDAIRMVGVRKTPEEPLVRFTKCSVHNDALLS